MCQVDGGRGFSNPTLLVGQGDGSQGSAPRRPAPAPVVRVRRFQGKDRRLHAGDTLTRIALYLSSAGCRWKPQS
jgi:hypothetical protein